MPRVSIGLPVYNGEKYIREAIESVLDQTFKDFELIISDNASTDRTEQICREYVDKDPRIRYYRNEKNLGAAKNFNRTFELSHGEYFKWLASDDAIESEFLTCCVDLMDSDPTLVLTCSKCISRNETTNVIRHHDIDCNLRLPTGHQRLRWYLWRLRIGKIPIWGLMRSQVLRTTQLIRPIIGADDCLLIELALKGKFGQVPEYLLRLRDHAGAFHLIKHRNNGCEGAAEAKWFDAGSKGKVFFPYWRRLREYCILVVRSDENFVSKLMIAMFLQFLLCLRWRRKLGSELLCAAGLSRHYVYIRLKKLITQYIPWIARKENV